MLPERFDEMYFEKKKGFGAVGGVKSTLIVSSAEM